MRTLLSLILLLAAAAAPAQDPLPKLELGAGLFLLEAPDYRGSSKSDTYLLPTPYIKYRGERVRVDEGAQGVIFESPDLLFTLSGNLSLPADDDTPEREGMDELDAIIEFGPSVNYRFYRLDDSAWWIDLPLRFAYTLDQDFDYVGAVFQPRLSWRKPMRRLGEWKLRFNIGPLFASDDYHEYFYSVTPEDATVSRAAYDAEGGYSGLRAEFTLSKRFGTYWLGGFLRYDDLDNSKIDDSPLVTDTGSWFGGIALAWVFHEE